MKTQTTGALTEISFTVPNVAAESVCKAIRSILEIVRSPMRAPVRAVDTLDQTLYTVAEVIPESSPQFRLRGLRAREGLTQKQCAARLGIRQHHISEMEKGVRPISVDMAKRIGDMFNVSYKSFV